MVDAQFHAVVYSLLRKLGVGASKEMPVESGICTLTVGTTQIELVGLQRGFINLFCFPGTGVKPLALSAPSLALLMAINRYQTAYPNISVSILNGSPAKLVLWSRLPLAEANQSALSDLFARFFDVSLTVQAWLKAGAPSAGSAAPISTLAKFKSLNSAPLIKKSDIETDPPQHLPDTFRDDDSVRGSSLASIAARYPVRLGSEEGPEQSALLVQRAMHQESGLSLIVKQLKAHADRR